MPGTLTPFNSERAIAAAKRPRRVKYKALHVIAEVGRLARIWRYEHGERLSAAIARRLITAALNPADTNSWRALELLLKLDPEAQALLAASAKLDTSGMISRIVINVPQVQAPQAVTVESVSSATECTLSDTPISSGSRVVEAQDVVGWQSESGSTTTGSGAQGVGSSAGASAQRGAP